jgi:hypothetical protein
VCFFPDFLPAVLRGDEKMPNPSMRVNDFQRENASVSLWRGAFTRGNRPKIAA